MSLNDKVTAQLEHDLMLMWLEKLGVIRPSMIGNGWWVVYTENGALDIHNDELRKLRTK